MVVETDAQWFERMANRDAAQFGTRNKEVLIERMAGQIVDVRGISRSDAYELARQSFPHVEHFSQIASKFSAIKEKLAEKNQTFDPQYQYASDMGAAYMGAVVDLRLGLGIEIATQNLNRRIADFEQSRPQS